jgi:hypothetical protein
MSAIGFAEDAVTVRRARLRGLSETALRRQFAAVPTPRVREFVFVRRVTLLTQAQKVGMAMQTALAKIAEDDRRRILTFADLPALAVACARAALRGDLGAWHWRLLDVPPMASPGEAVTALLTAHAAEAGSMVAALAEQGLLAAVWRDLSEAAAARLIAALSVATGFSAPALPSDVPRGPLPAHVEVLLARATAMWGDALRPLPPRSAAVMAAAFLSLLRWSPGALRSPRGPVWPTLVARLAGAASVAQAPSEAAQAPPEVAQAPSAQAAAAARNVAPPATEAAHSGDDPAATETPSPRHGQMVETGWGGVLFLINALRRLEVETLLDDAGPDAPSGWRLLHDLGVAFGLPEDEPLALFLAAQDLDTVVPLQLLALLIGRIEALYRPDGPWPLPLAQQACLWATETHLDLDLETQTVDVALRLSGLDLDPKWVPWLGRVVTFHYIQIHTHHLGSR